MNHYSKLCRSKQVHQLKEGDVSRVSSDDSGDSGDESPPWCTRLNQRVAPDEQFYETVEVEETQVEEFQEINTVRVGRVPERDQSRNRATSSPNNGENLMTRHKAASCYGVKTRLYIP